MGLGGIGCRGVLISRKLWRGWLIFKVHSRQLKIWTATKCAMTWNTWFLVRKSVTTTMKRRSLKPLLRFPRSRILWGWSTPVPEWEKNKPILRRIIERVWMRRIFNLNIIRITGKVILKIKRLTRWLKMENLFKRLRKHMVVNIILKISWPLIKRTLRWVVKRPRTLQRVEQWEIVTKNKKKSQKLKKHLSKTKNSQKLMNFLLKIKKSQKLKKHFSKTKKNQKLMNLLSKTKKIQKHKKHL